MLDFINELKEFNGREIMNSGTAPVPSGPSPVLLHNNEDIHQHEEVEESLNIMDKEKELIEKALKKA